MQVFLIVAPVFALIVIGYAGAASRLFSENAHKGIAEYAFSIAIPALLFRTIAVADTGDIEPFRLWASYFAAVVATWVLATLITRGFLKRPAADGAAIAISSVYGNVVMLGIPLGSPPSDPRPPRRWRSSSQSTRRSSGCPAPRT